MIGATVHTLSARQRLMHYRSEAENTSQEQESPRQSEPPEDSEESAPGTPESQQKRLYSQSPTKDKRRRMEKLAEERANKRSRS